MTDFPTFPYTSTAEIPSFSLYTENGTEAFSPLSGLSLPTPPSSAFCRVHIVGSFVLQIQ